jgi:hypothetical protein
MKELSADLLQLAKHIPKTGRLKFKLMPPEVKEEIIAFLEMVLEKNADCGREFKKYVYAAVELSKYYSDKPETHTKAGKTAYDDMMKRLENVVLKEIKKMNRQERGKGQVEKQEAYQRERMESLIIEIFGILSRAASAGNIQVHHARLKGELSKQAKKELALKLENSSDYGWE